MTTKKAGGKITGLLALTMEAQVALKIGHAVHVIGDYEVTKADGTKPVLGTVSVSNHNRRVSDAFSTSVNNAEVPGDVTVEARGFYVKTFKSAAAITAGSWVVIGADDANGMTRIRAYDPTAAPGAADTADEVIGIALMGVAAADLDIDVLVR